MGKVEINETMPLSEHMTLGEVTKSRHEGIYNIPSHVAIENLKRVCEWLEELRRRYNLRYVFSRNEEGGMRNENSWEAEKKTEEPIVINSGYRSPQLNRKVGGSRRAII